MTWALVTLLFFASGHVERHDLRIFQSREACETASTWSAPSLAVVAGAGGVKYWCEPGQ